VNNAAHWEADTFLPSPKDLVNKTVEVWTSAPKQIDFSSFDRVFAVNTRAIALMVAEFGKRHIKRQASWGRIINISTDGAYCFPSEISYGASKLAMEGYTRSAAQEFGQFGITVNAVSPGPIQTGWITPEMEKEIAASNPMKSVGQPEHIADAVIFFASDQARWITGQRLHVGGGNAM
jgi:3-oxoacyl-[acyl-carrier protein] reductase